MSGAAEHLQRQCWVHAACSFFQKPDVLIFGLTNSAERGAETDAGPILRPLPRIFDPSVIERHLCGCHGKLRIAIKPLQAMRREEFVRVPISNFAAAMRI